MAKATYEACIDCKWKLLFDGESIKGDFSGGGNE